MKGFIHIAASEFAATLLPLGFVPGVANREVVYDWAHPVKPEFKVRVYTSLSIGATECREAGADAIRVCAVYVAPSGKTFGVGKTTRVNRTGYPAAVLSRMLCRIGDVRLLLEGYVKVEPCKCGSPRWPDSGNCMAKCWSKGTSYKPYVPKKTFSGYKPKFGSYGWKNNEDVGVDYGPDGD